MFTYKYKYNIILILIIINLPSIYLVALALPVSKI